MDEIEFCTFNEIFLEKSFEWLHNPRIKELVDSCDFNRDEQRKWFNTLDDRDDYLIWGIMSNGLPIGVVGIKNIDYEKQEGEYFGYIGEAVYWGKGIGVKMLEHTKDIAKIIGLRNIFLKVRSDNERAINLYKKFGFLPTKGEMLSIRI